jgi:hypothetical protein
MRGELKEVTKTEEIDIDFNEPIKVDFQGEGKLNGTYTSFYAVNDYIVTVEQLHELVKQKRDAIWHFGFDSLRIFMSEVS